MSDDIKENTGPTFETLKLDYEKTTSYFQSLHDTRFKLLGLLPLISIISFFIAPSLSNKVEIIFGLLGMTTLVGITIYDQRNNMIYDRLTRRAAFLEKLMGFPPLPTDKVFGGPFHSRPGRRKLWGIPIIWHDMALAIVYSASFAAWAIIFSNGALHRWGWPFWLRGSFVLIMTSLYFSIYLCLVNQNDKDNHAIIASLAATAESDHPLPSPSQSEAGSS